MKKILGVVGSPRRKGNTEALVSAILAGAEEEGAQTDLLFLEGLRIRECDGCHACWKGRTCSKKDDMNAIYSRIAQSDILVFGTPVYWYGPTALMKAFLDRFVFFNCPENRPKVKDKSTVLAVPFEEEKPETAEILLGMFHKSLAYLEMKIAGEIIAPGVTLPGDVLKKKEIMQRAYDLGRKSVLVTRVFPRNPDRPHCLTRK